MVTPTHDTCLATQPHLTQIPNVCEHLRHQDGPCHRKNGNRWHGQQEDRDHAGPGVLDDEVVVVPFKDKAQKHVISHSFDTPLHDVDC